MSSRDPLDELLDRWQVPTREVPDLKPLIRREIAAAAAPSRRDWIARLDLAFARPSFAMLFIAACVLLGLFLAETRVAHLHAKYGAQVARSYVQLIDPLLDPPHLAPGRKAAP
jgi:hypothetical protein